jgi:prefoldin subunit 5
MITINNSITSINTEIDNIKSEIDSLTDGYDTQIAAINTSITNINSSISDINDEIISLKAADTSLQTQITNLSNSVDTRFTNVNTTTDGLQTQINSLVTSVNGCVKFIISGNNINSDNPDSSGIVTLKPVELDNNDGITENRDGVLTYQQYKAILDSISTLEADEPANDGNVYVRKTGQWIKGIPYQMIVSGVTSTIGYDAAGNILLDSTGKIQFTSGSNTVLIDSTGVKINGIRIVTTTDLDGLKTTIGNTLLTSLTEDTTNVNTTRLTVQSRNPITGTNSSSNLDLTLATSSKSGIMPKESFNQITTNTQDIAALKGASRRYPTTEELPGTLTQSQVQTIYESAGGSTSPNDNDSLISFNSNTINYVWTYYSSIGGWYFRGIDTVQLATQSAPGIVQGSITDGKILVENDGTMSLNGYDDIVNGLSTNDYTTAEKAKLAGIQTGAEVNVQSDWNITDNTSDAFIKNKPTIPGVVQTTGTSTIDVMS